LDPPAVAGDAPDDCPTILIYAREHAPESDSSVGLTVMLCWLLSATPEALQARQALHWLLIPMLDPDDAAHERFDVGDNFIACNPPAPDALAYAAYLVKWIDAGHRLDMVINLHNIECNENPWHLFAP